MQRHHLGRLLALAQLLLDLGLPGPQFAEPSSPLILAHQPLDQQIQRTLYFAPRRIEAPLDPAAIADEVARQAPPLVVVGSDVRLDQSRMLQALAQAAHHRALHCVEIVRPAIVAATRLLGERAMDADAAVILVFDRHAAAARAAPEQPGQGMLGLAHLRNGADRSILPHGLRRAEQIRVDDREVRGGGGVMLALGVGPRDAPAGVGVLDHADPIPDDPAGIDRVLEDAVAALAVAVDGDRGPVPPPGRRNQISVEPGRDGARALAAGVLPVNTTDDLRLGLDDGEFARPAGDRRIAVGAATGVAARGNDAGEPAANLFGAVLALHLADQAEQPDHGGVHGAAVHRPQLDPGEHKSLVDLAEIAHRARQAIGMLDHEHVEAALARMRQQLDEAVAAEDR